MLVFVLTWMNTYDFGLAQYLFWTILNNLGNLYNKYFVLNISNSYQNETLD